MTAGTMHGVAVALWLFGLWFSSKLLTPIAQSAADVVRNAILIGIAIPFVLGIISMLTAPLCFSVLVLLIAFALIRAGRSWLKYFKMSTFSHGAWLPIVVILMVAWPAVVRPELQGDSLGYHLPNAASWVTAHSIWTSGNTYWWYPGASELFDSALFAIGAQPGINFSGIPVLIVLAMRIYEMAQAERWDPCTSGALAAAVVSIPAYALQAASLENDVWLAAFCLESIAFSRRFSSSAYLPLSMLALIKPYGWIFALVIAVSFQTPIRVFCIAFVPFAVWVARDVLLASHNPLIDPGAVSIQNIFGTTIIGNGILGLSTLVKAVVHQGIGLTVAVLCASYAMIFSKDRRLQFCIAALSLCFLIEPFSFRNDVPQLETGASLRYALPAVTLGIMAIMSAAGFASRSLLLPLILLIISQVYFVDHIFFNDATTHGVVVVAATLIAGLFADRVRLGGIATAMIAMALVAYASRLEGTHPLDYLNDVLKPRDTEIFSWIATREPVAVVGDGLRVGMISMASPATIVYDSDRKNACSQARRLNALLVFADTEISTARAITGFPLTCGRVLFKDAGGMVLDPSGLAIEKP